ncbi:heterokaryon incompatibility protein-domain-containing protein [Pisolithus tinctorius]|nr:heterokaryon incompatibility protein-domain-containing protein [Pisolithus tinctorius]
MWLLDVRAVLHREENIQQAGSKTKVLEELDDKTTEYAILSHRWGKEVDYNEMTGLMKMDEQDRNEVRQRDGYRKIIKSCEQSMTDGYTWLWIDTCCIDKRSSVALSEAIGTMYRWYCSSQLCYVYLNDVDDLAFPTEPDFNRFGRSNSWPEWFSRGWTLQELIAPTEVEFFNKDWVSISTKRDLTYTISRITGISSSILWWVEDRAYSLLGLFDVNMPMLYGEGSKAFRRLQFEIIRASSNHTIFAWNPKGCLMTRAAFGAVMT